MRDKTMKIREQEKKIIAVDQARQFGVVEMGEWEEADGSLYLHGDRDLGYDATRRTHVLTDRVEAPPVAATVIDATTGERRTLSEGEAADISPETLVILRTPVLVHVRADATGEIRHTITETEIVFDEPVPVSLGFESKMQASERTVRVERSPEGVARAVSALSPTDTTSPDRTWPAAREMPPAIEFDTTTNYETFDTPDTGLELTVPGEDTLAHLFPAASLAYYLDATVSVARDASETRLHDGARSWTLGATPEETDQTASEWLRRIFYLDCHARRAGPHGERLAGGEILDERLGLDAERLYDADMGERVRTYLDITDDEADAVADAVPKWHLGVHVEPRLNLARNLPQHLGRLADIYQPEAATLENLADRISWGQKELVRGGLATTAGEPTAMVAPDKSRAETVGWDIEHTDGSHRALGAYNVDGPVEPRPLDDSNISVTVVRASASYRVEGVVDEYEKREPDLPMDVNFVGSPTSERLKEIIAKKHDLLHIVGHHEAGHGLQCRDDTFLSATEIDECGAETFFINACGTLGFAEELVEKGAVAGVGTTRVVTDDIARSVGMKWAWLVSEGWAVERATEMVRKIHDPSGYVTLGDGTHLVRESDMSVPPEISIKEIKDQTHPWQVKITHNGPRSAGGKMQDGLAEQRHLRGDHRTYRVTEEELISLAKKMDNPVLYDGSLVGPETLL
jgi:hypothetical protein